METITCRICRNQSPDRGEGLCKRCLDNLERSRKIAALAGYRIVLVEDDE